MRESPQKGREIAGLRARWPSGAGRRRPGRLAGETFRCGLITGACAPGNKTVSDFVVSVSAPNPYGRPGWSSSPKELLPDPVDEHLVCGMIFLIDLHPGHAVPLGR